MNYEQTPEFEHDFKKLMKRFRTLAEDFAVLKKHRLEFFHSAGCGLDDPVKIQNMCGTGFISYKVRKIACKSLKNRGVMSGLRIVYVYFPESDTICFVEIYFKADKENEDKDRLKNFISKKTE